MRNSIMTLAAVLLTLSACDLEVRADLVDVECDATECTGRWDGTAMRTKLYPAGDLVTLPDAPEAWSNWECMPNPDADACVYVDGHGHMACIRVYGEWAVPVAPSCAVSGPGWLGVGVGMSSPVLVN